MNDKDLATLKSLTGRIELAGIGCLSPGEVIIFRTLRRADRFGSKPVFSIEANDCDCDKGAETMTDNDRKRLGTLTRRIMLARGVPGLLQFIESLAPTPSVPVMEEYERAYCNECGLPKDGTCTHEVPTFM